MADETGKQGIDYREENAVSKTVERSPEDMMTQLFAGMDKTMVFYAGVTSPCLSWEKLVKTYHGKGKSWEERPWGKLPL